MSDAQNPSVSDDGQSAGSAQAGQAPETKDQVSYETHRRLLSEKKELAARLASIETERRAAAEKEAREKEDFKKMVELRDQELNQLREEYSGLKNQVYHAVKRSTFEEAIGIKIPKQYERLIDYDAIVFDPSTNSVDELSLSKYVDQFKKDFREIMMPQAVPGVSQQAPKGAQPQRSKDDVLSDFAKILKGN
jgi:hypothetical protein